MTAHAGFSRLCEVWLSCLKCSSAWTSATSPLYRLAVIDALSAEGRERETLAKWSQGTPLLLSRLRVLGACRNSSLNKSA